MALGSLRRRLSVTWLTSEEASLRRERLFSIWEDCDSTSDIGRRARDTVCDFIVENLPASSPLAYAEAELQRLNRGRRDKDRFDPYAGRSRSSSDPGDDEDQPGSH